MRFTERYQPMFLAMETDNMTDVLTIVVVPLLGMVGWFIKSGMGKMTAAIESNSRKMSELISHLTTSEIRAGLKIAAIEDSMKRQEIATGEALKTYAKACQLSEVEADKIGRAASKTLRDG